MGKNKRAVAIKYDDGIEVPIIMAKGNGKTAEKILEEAEINNIPVTEDGPLVEMLGLQEQGSQVPEEAWSALAKIFAFILERK